METYKTFLKQLIPCTVYFCRRITILTLRYLARIIYASNQSGGGPWSRITAPFPAKIPNSSFVTKNNNIKKSSKAHLTRYWVIRICRSNVRSPEFPGKVKKNSRIPRISRLAHPASQVSVKSLYQLRCDIARVFPNPAPYFGQIPNPENTLPDLSSDQKNSFYLGSHPLKLHNTHKID